MDMACRLAAERRARIVALNVVEVPLDQALTERAPELEAAANSRLDQAVAIGDSYGVRVVTRLERAHAAGPAIVAEADARNAEIIVLGSPRGSSRRARRRSSARRSTTCSSTRAAACSSLLRRPREAVLARRDRLAVLFVVIGVALLVRTAAVGGGVVGYVLGALFVVLGVARFTLERKRGR